MAFPECPLGGKTHHFRPDLCVVPVMMLRPVILRYNSAIPICLKHLPQIALKLDLKALIKDNLLHPLGAHSSGCSSSWPESRLCFSSELSCLSFPDIVFCSGFLHQINKALNTCCFLPMKFLYLVIKLLLDLLLKNQTELFKNYRKVSFFQNCAPSFQSCP